MNNISVTASHSPLVSHCGRCRHYGNLTHEVTSPFTFLRVCDPCADEARRIITERNGASMQTMVLKQEQLIKPTKEEVAAWKNELAECVTFFVKTEEEKKAADAEFTDRLNATWKQIQQLEARISAAK